MTYWTWDQSLSVGMEVIDRQHRRIVDYINELDDARRKKDRARVTQVLMGLIDYAQTHFAFEEALMEQAGYPLTELHKRVHDSFAGHIHRYVAQHESGQDVSRKLTSELQLWLTNHIKNDDRDYAPYAAKLMNKSWIRRTLSRFFG
jgi:hemerythrin